MLRILGLIIILLYLMSCSSVPARMYDGPTVVDDNVWAGGVGNAQYSICSGTHYLSFRFDGPDLVIAIIPGGSEVIETPNSNHPLNDTRRMLKTNGQVR